MPRIRENLWLKTNEKRRIKNSVFLDLNEDTSKEVIAERTALITDYDDQIKSISIQQMELGLLAQAFEDLEPKVEETLSSR